MIRFTAAALAGAVILLGGCSEANDPAEEQPSQEPSPAPPSSFRALFVPQGGIVPFPNDLFFNGSTDGTLNLPVTAFTPNAQALNTLDGYSTTAPIRARFSESLDPASLLGGQTVHVFEVQVDPATKATVGFVSALVPGTDYSIGIAPDIDSNDSILELTPLGPLNEKSGYLVVLTDGIRSSDGTAAVPDNVFQTIKDALADGATLPDPTLDAIKQLTGAHFAIASAVGIDPASIVSSFSFSTQSNTDVMLAVDATTTAQAAGLQFAGLDTSQVDPRLTGSADVYVGTVGVPYYLSRTAPLTDFWLGGPSPLDATSNFLTRFNPVPVATETLVIPALLTLPNVNSAFVMAGGSQPAEGWPVIVFQHGITRNRTDMLALADGFADAGWAVIAIDQPLHGLTDPMNPLFQAGNERTFDLDLVNNADSSPGPDGSIDPSGTHYINLTSLPTTRDNLRQSAADLIALTRTVPVIDLNADQVPDLNADRIHFVGQSLGAMVGTTYLGVNSDVRTATLANGGGTISVLIRESPSFGPRITAGLEAAGLIADTTLFNQFFRDAQTVIDSGDPINFAEMAAALHPIHMMEVLGDTVVPNSATERLVDEMGLPTISMPGPNLTSYGIVRFTEGNHGSLLDPTASFAVTVEMQTETVVFAAGNALAGLPGDGQVILIS
ncbi:MAG: alpha/beta fold hydrolase, partial [Gammaproteobacteria bacterium]|nr:alpha/beta fold hydrolase [Gammaproteobacteria bacterium]